MRNAIAWILALLFLAATGLSVARRFLAPERRTMPPPGFVRIEVVNGTGVPRMGREVMRVLQMRGFNVYSTATAADRAGRTTVVDLRDRAGGNARMVANALSRSTQVIGFPVGPEFVPAESVAIDSARYLEALLLVGSDYLRFLPEARPLR